MGGGTERGDYAEELADKERQEFRCFVSEEGGKAVSK